MMYVCLKFKIVGMMGLYIMGIYSRSNARAVRVVIRRSRRRKMETCRLMQKKKTFSDDSHDRDA